MLRNLTLHIVGRVCSFDARKNRCRARWSLEKQRRQVLRSLLLLLELLVACSNGVHGQYGCKAGAYVQHTLLWILTRVWT